MSKTTGTRERDCGRVKVPYKTAVGVSKLIGSATKGVCTLGALLEELFGEV